MWGYYSTDFGGMKLLTNTVFKGAEIDLCDIFGFLTPKTV
jgi:hypothetical protein